MSILIRSLCITKINREKVYHILKGEIEPTVNESDKIIIIIISLTFFVGKYAHTKLFKRFNLIICVCFTNIIYYEIWYISSMDEQ